MHEMSGGVKFIMRYNRHEYSWCCFWSQHRIGKHRHGGIADWGYDTHIVCVTTLIYAQFHGW